MNIKLIAYSAAMLSTLLLGSVGLFVRNISANAYLVTFSRLSIGLLLLFILLAVKKELRGINRASFSFSMLATGVLLALAILCYTEAINNTSLANAAFLLYLGPIIAVGLTALFLNERFTRLNGIYLALAFVGFLLLMEFNFSFKLGASKGYLWGVCAALCYALYIVFNRKISKDISTLTRAFYQFLFAAIFMLAFLDSSIFTLSSTDLYWLVAIGIFQGFFATTLLIFAIKYLKAVEYGTISYIEPIVAAILGWLFYSEYLTPLQLSGCVIVFCCGIAQLFSVKRASAKRVSVKTVSIKNNSRKK